MNPTLLFCLSLAVSKPKICQYVDSFNNLLCVNLHRCHIFGLSWLFIGVAFVVYKVRFVYCTSRVLVIVGMTTWTNGMPRLRYIRLHFVVFIFLATKSRFVCSFCVLFFLLSRGNSMGK